MRPAAGLSAAACTASSEAYPVGARENEAPIFRHRAKGANQPRLILPRLYGPHAEDDLFPVPRQSGDRAGNNPVVNHPNPRTGDIQKAFHLRGGEGGYGNYKVSARCGLSWPESRIARGTPACCTRRKGQRGRERLRSGVEIRREGSRWLRPWKRFAERLPHESARKRRFTFDGLGRPRARQ